MVKSLKSKQVKTVYSDASAPLTSLCFSEDALFTGCWDKSIHSVSLEHFRPLKRYIGGHDDFVKSVACVNVKRGDLAKDTEYSQLLISGGADGYIVVWNIESGAKLHVLRGHSLSVLDLTINPNPLPSATNRQEQVECWSAGSDRTIRKWTISEAQAHQLPFTHSEHSDEAEDQLIVHDTGVNRIRFEKALDVLESGSIGEGHLLTASSDKTAKYFAISTKSQDEQADPYLSLKEGQSFAHPDFVNDIVALPSDGLIATACRDEAVRVWDPEIGDDPVMVFDGHFEEVTALCTRKIDGEDVLVSASIDATIRVWPATLAGIERWKIEMKQRELEQAKPSQQDGEKGKRINLTAEEEAELAELMEDD